MDEGKLKEQLAYLSEIRTWSDRKLRSEYIKVFEGTIYYVQPSMDIPRDWIERRMYYVYALRNSCYNDDPTAKLAFKRVAKSVLLEPPPNKDESLQRRLSRQLKKRAIFSKRNVKRLDEAEVDAYLALLGITLTDVSIGYKRKVLWEYYNAKATDLPMMVSNKRTPKLVTRPKRRNQFDLSQLILAFPRMGWPEFLDAFGDVMPNVKRETFYNTRYKLKRRYGNVLPKLLPGRRAPKLLVKYDQHNRVQARPVVNPREAKLGVIEFEGNYGEAECEY